MSISELVFSGPGYTIPSTQHKSELLLGWSCPSPSNMCLLLAPRLPGTAGHAAAHDSGRETYPAENSPAGREAGGEISFPLLVLLSHILCLSCLPWMEQSRLVLCLEGGVEM